MIVQVIDTAASSPAGLVPIFSDADASGEAIVPPGPIEGNFPSGAGWSIRNGLLVCLSSNVSDPTAYVSAGNIAYYSLWYRSQ
jgi:hypothetical protein